MNIKIITPDDGYNYFFGYYDLQPFSSDNRIHLAHRVKFCNRLPEKTDVAEVGYIDIKDRQFVKVAETRAWNFQQGAFLRWFKQDESITFNDFDGEKYVAKIVSLNGEVLRVYDKPFAALSENTGKALSVNFARIYDFRKGYGYCNISDPHFNENAPDDDGIFEIDLKTGAKRLVLSYFQMKSIFAQSPYTDQKLVVNHITYSPSGRKFVYLLRNIDPEGKMWATMLATGTPDGETAGLTKFEVNSHYSWRNDEELMIYSGLPKWGIYFFDVITGRKVALNNPLTDKNDIHCNYSPDRRCFIGDGYIETDGKRHLYLYDFKKGVAKDLFAVYSMPVETDIRCDLHARWNIRGDKVSYDTSENGIRQIATFDFKE